MKPYLLFAGIEYYGRGGMNDFQGDFETVDDAKAAFTKQRETEWFDEAWEWCQIAEHTSMKVVARVGRCYGEPREVMPL